MADRFLDRANEEKFELVALIPFTSERMVMTVAYIDKEEDPEKIKVIMKGAPEEIIRRCVSSYDEFGY